jgi:hypothetical protein
MSNPTECLSVIDCGSAAPVYADNLVIEQHGAASHLVFCHTQKEYVGSDRSVAVVGCRVIVPTAVLARLAHRLACPDLVGLLPQELVTLQ